MYTIRIAAADVGAVGPKKRSSAVHIPEHPWVVSSYGRPTSRNLTRFIQQWEAQAKRTHPLQVTRAMVMHRKASGLTQLVATYDSQLR